MIIAKFCSPFSNYVSPFAIVKSFSLCLVENVDESFLPDLVVVRVRYIPRPLALVSFNVCFVVLLFDGKKNLGN
jgi:hypothetical protein